MNQLIRWRKAITNEMHRQVFKVISLFTLSIALIYSIFFVEVASTNALEKSLSQEANGDNPLGIVIEQAEDNEDMNTNPDIANYPDLGSDQVFPFVAGLDSYE
ncbi:hypothetical protein [Prochlorococcus marinus]|uniref:Uncharacterized protein n=1 Tax=Prochlorococcus marinus (strain MIT 9211) TaxID=93059 RepID=A9B9Q1_PROM4|nr:hypothetical protein [Prochlorococcus marinus]ABX08563.1 Hypothetical protein P9211_06321 [Prochlorococcus marinus str. MIT 9211]